MATKLKKMRLTSVDLVRAGANQEADICLFKSADPPEVAEQPTEAETNIFKRFLAWIRENPAEAENEPHSHIEKAEDQPDLEYLYKSALAESLQSIMADETLTEIEKKSMTEESLRQYADKIQELEREEERIDEEEDRLEGEADDDDHDDDIEEEIIEEVAERRRKPRIRYEFEEIEEVPQRKSNDGFIDYIEESQVRKYNHNHGADGKFSSSPGGGGGTSSGSGGGATSSAGNGSSSGSESGGSSSGGGGGSRNPSKMTEKELGDAYFAAHDKMGDKSLSRSEKEAITRDFEAISAEMDRRCEARGTVPYIDHSNRTIDLT